MFDQGRTGGREGAGRSASDSRLSLLRELGEQAVLETIFSGGPVTRPELAAVTGLSKPTVSGAVSRLEQAGMIHAVGQRHGRRGRSPMAYVVRDNAGFVIGVDIGGSNIRVGAADIFGEPICDEQHATTKDGERALSAQLLDVADRVVQRAGATHDRLLAVGISTPGVIDQESHQVMLAYNVSPDGGFDPLGAIGTRWGVPVLIDNNVNLAAVGEKWFGLARGVSTMVFIAVGAGIGMGVVIDHELVRGAHGAAGEIGYLPLVGDPFDPRHRLRGGLEDEVAAAGILAAFKARQDSGVAGPTSPQEVFALAQDGDPEAGRVVEHVASRLGAAIATVCAIIDPELIVLGGGIGANPLLLRPVRAAVAALVPVAGRIETSRLADRAALHGAIAVALNAARSELLTQHAAAPEARKNVAGMRLEIR